jgi:hypothetical protein
MPRVEGIEGRSEISEFLLVSHVGWWILNVLTSDRVLDLAVSIEDHDDGILLGTQYVFLGDTLRVRSKLGNPTELETGLLCPQFLSLLGFGLEAFRRHLSGEQNEKADAIPSPDWRRNRVGLLRNRPPAKQGAFCLVSRHHI